MKKALLPFFLFIIFLSYSPLNPARALSLQKVETMIGQPAGESSGDGSSLGFGELRPPFKCGLYYTGLSYYGHTHWAVDFNRGAAGPYGGDFDDPVYAAADGTIKQLIPTWGQIHIQHEGGYMTAYTHMNKVLVKLNQKVKAGEQVGTIGNRCGAGCTLSSHLHFHVCGKVEGCMTAKTQSSVKMKFFNKDYPISCYNCDSGPGAKISCTWP